MYPLVSIIIPVYNAEKYVAETIQSAMDQTWPNKEIFIIDDGSTDDSLSIAKKYENSWIRVVHQVNKGASAARNVGLDLSKGDYIQFLDADDLLSPNKISEQMCVLKNDNGAIVTCATIHLNGHEDHHSKLAEHFWYQKGSDNPYDFLLKLYSHETDMPGYGGMISVHSWLTPKSVIENAGKWNESLSVDDDGEFFCRVVLASQRVRYSFNAISYYRHFLGNNSLSAQKNRAAYTSMLEALKLKHSYLKSAGNHPLANQIISRHYWWIGVACFPRHIRLYQYCMKTAKTLGFNGSKYNGGRRGKLISLFLGWKLTRILAYLKNGF